MGFLRSSGFFGCFLRFCLDFFDLKKKNYISFFFYIFFIFFVFCFYWFFPKLLRLLLKITKVTNRHQQWPKMGQNSIISPFFARSTKKASAESRSPPKELVEGPRRRPYLLVYIIFWMKISLLFYFFYV